MNVSIIVLIGLLGLGMVGQYKANKLTRQVETPKYTVLGRYAQFEVRSYPEMIIATTSMGVGDYSSQSTKGFRTIASYIFGGNEENKKISMTAPVISSIEDTMRMSFIMPAAYSLSELPQPNNKQVDLKVQPERVMAVIRFGGFASNKDLKRYTALLQESLAAQGLDPSGKIYFQGYNPPFQLLNRTNEVAIEMINYE